MGKQWKQWQTIFLASKSLQMVIAAMKLKDAYSLEGKLPLPAQFQMAEHFSQEQDLDQDTVLRHHVGNPSNTDAEYQPHAWGRTDAEAEIPVLWPPDAKNWLIWKDPDAGRLKAWGDEDYRNGHEYK